MEKFSSIERVVGKVTKEDKAEIINIMGSTFENQDFKDKSLTEAEREKIPKEIEIINLADNATNEIRKKYGMKKFDIPPKNIHIIKKDSWDTDDNEGRLIGGYFDQKGQRIIMRESLNRIRFMKTVFHEMLHFKSYNALQVENVSNSKVEPYRSGISGASRNYSTGYLHSINEAVTEELTKRFSSKLYDNPIFAEEVSKTKEALAAHSTNIQGKPLPKNAYEDVYYASDSKFGLQCFEHTYKSERDALQLLIDKLFERNKENYNNQEEIFELFAKGFMTGNILPIGKLIDKTFGKGTLRKIGDNNKNTYKIVESL